MLTISPQQHEAVAADAFMRELHGFMIERVQDPATRALLADQAACVATWRTVYRAGDTDYAQALRLAVALIARAQGRDVAEQMAAIDTAPDPDHAAKAAIEATGAMRYSEFDIE